MPTRLHKHKVLLVQCISSHPRRSCFYIPVKEYRIIATSTLEQVAAFDIDIDIDVIRRITISNKVPKPIFLNLKKVIKDINPKFTGKIVHTTLFRNETWINHFKGSISAPMIK